MKVESNIYSSKEATYQIMLAIPHKLQKINLPFTDAEDTELSQ